MLKIYDDHIDDKVRESLVHSNEYQSFNQEDYRWWDFKTPTDQIQETLNHIWKDLINFDDYAGIEYWVTKLEGESSGIWHLDLVEQEQHKGYNPGDLTVVYYPWVDCTGGFLELMCNDNRPSRDEMYLMLRRLDPNILERIQPITNRAVFFNSNRVHRMSRMYSGTREMLASTVWKKKPLTFN